MPPLPPLPRWLPQRPAPPKANAAASMGGHSRPLTAFNGACCRMLDATSRKQQPQADATSQMATQTTRCAWCLWVRAVPSVACRSCLSLRRYCNIAIHVDCVGLRLQYFFFVGGLDYELRVYVLQHSRSSISGTMRAFLKIFRCYPIRWKFKLTYVQCFPILPTIRLYF
jgi:hypothetical protein